MNRLFALSALVAGSVLLLGSCQEIDDNNVSVSHDGKIMITAEFPECIESKVAASDGTASLELAWEDDDYLTVVSGSVSEIFTMVSHDGKTAMFSGNPVKASSYDVFLSKSTDYQTRSYNGQTQTTVASTDHLEYEAVLKGVTSYTAVNFTDTWAKENGGELLQNGCLQIYFKMPEDAGKLKSVTLTAPSEIFYTTNTADGKKTATLSLALSDADMVADNTVKAHIMTSMQEASIPADAQLTLTVVSNIGTWSKAFTPGASVLEAGKRNVIKLNSENWTVPAGDGSQDNPYIIRTVSDLTGMAGKVDKTSTKYFAMVNDIDMSSITEWISISEQLIDFNGNNRTLSNFSCSAGSYRGFVRILNGRIANVTFVNAKVAGDASDGTQPCGIVCGYCGNGGATCYGEIENVHVQGVVTGNGGGVGGVTGVLAHGKINRCSADVNVTNASQRAGGIAGYHNNNNVASICEISNCWTSGSLVALKHQKNGGIIGEMYANAKDSPVAVLTNCYSTMSLNVSRNAGGIVGALHQNGKSKVERCIAWNTRIESATSQTGWYSSGAVVGFMKNKDTMTDNYRRLDMVFDVKYTDKNYEVPQLFDCENFDNDNPFAWTSYNDGNYWGTYYQPYHGKAAAAGETVSDVARRIGWSEDVWDLSGPLPVLKR